MKYKRALITGGAGFIGTHLEKRLLKMGLAVGTYDIAEQGELDVRDEQQVKDWLECGWDIIFSLASTAGIDRVAADPQGTIETNINGVQNLLKHKGDAKLVHFSTSEAYGERADRNTETDATHVGAAGNPRWTYQASKVCADHLIMAADPDALIVRPFNVFGEHQEGHGAIADFIDWGLKGEGIKIYGDGSQLRSWVYVEDFLDAVLALVEKDAKGIYNVGDPTTPITIKELAEEIAKETGEGSELYYEPLREVDVFYRVPNIDKLTELTGWKPKHDFHEALKQVINHKRK
jgi:nucleoside-diphosphate-sugar epimerase